MPQFPPVPPPRKPKVVTPPEPQVAVPDKVYIVWNGVDVVAHVWIDEKGLHARRPDHAIVTISLQEALDAIEGQRQLL